MNKQSIIVVPYSSEWPKVFARLKDIYLQHLPPSVRAIEHVGSTAVPGLDAKPVLDIDIIVDRGPSIINLIERLAALGYRHVGDRGIPGREAFKRLDEKVPYDGSGAVWPDHHLYVCSAGSISLRNHSAIPERPARQ